MINEMSREKPDEKIVRQLEEYIGDNLLTSESREQLRRWCKVNQIDIEVFVDGALRYRSAFVPHNDEDTIPESEEDRERAYQQEPGRSWLTSIRSTRRSMFWRAATLQGRLQ